MQLQSIPRVDELDIDQFRKEFYEPQKPVIMTRLAHNWPAFQKWDWSYLKQQVGDAEVGVYNNIKSDAYTPINKADDYMKFGDYLDKVQKGPVELRIFLFNIFDHAPQLVSDFSWPDELMKGFVKRYPMLFVGGQGSVTHMHFDIDMSHILHTQFMGSKKILLFPYEEQSNLYRKPWEVLSFANFEKYGEADSKLDLQKFPAISKAKGYETVLGHGETLFMPAGYWHHMEYLESGFAMSLRAMQPSLFGKAKGLWNLVGMRNIDTLLKKTAPEWWYNRKWKQALEKAEV